MKLVDLNVLIYATDTETKHHGRSKGWLDRTMRSSETVALPTAVTVGFIRLTTNPRIMRTPLTPGQAIDTVSMWLKRSNVTVPTPTLRHYDLIGELISATGVGGNLVSDAHLAALAIEHGAELCTFDTDFARFPGLVTIQPD